MSTLSDSTLQITSLPNTNTPCGSEAICSELASGLTADNAFISPKFLYDTLGSKLFEAICLLPEYYPTRTEAAIFNTNLAQIARKVGLGSTLIDLGAGNCAKAASLFSALRPRQYVPIDISAEFLQQAVFVLQQRFPAIEMTPLGQDFSSNLNLPSAVPLENRVFFYPGSSIGNFPPAQALAFLRRLHTACGETGALLLGIDLQKPTSILLPAYDDALGVTAAFNLNVLRNVNYLSGTDFVLDDWAHVAVFNSVESRVEMHLRARRPVTASWPDGETRHFTQNTSIHTESSYKYSLSAFSDMLNAAGFCDIHTWTDPLDWFGVIYAKPTHPPPG